jgi:hypothetical protein
MVVAYKNCAIGLSYKSRIAVLNISLVRIITKVAYIALTDAALGFSLIKASSPKLSPDCSSPKTIYVDFSCAANSIIFVLVISTCPECII